MSSKLPPPESLNFDKPTEWPVWKERFNRYRTATKLDKEEGSVQVSQLIYVMGIQAEDVYKQFVFTDDADKSNFDIVLKKFSDYFVPKVNIIHERKMFNLRTLRQGENVETFIRDLYTLSEHCDFTDRNDMIRDKIVVSIKNKELSERLQTIAMSQEKLTLEKTLEIVRSHELVDTNDMSNIDVDRVYVPKKQHNSSVSFQSNATRCSSRNRSRSHSRKHQPQQQQHQKCGNCGYLKHHSGKCPAMGQKCNKCHKMNHFSSMCYSTYSKSQSKSVSEVSSHEPNVASASVSNSESEFYVGEVQIDSANTIFDDIDEPPWYVDLPVLDRNPSFKIDTGADVNVISVDVYDKLVPRPKLNQYTGGPLKSLGGTVNTKGYFYVTSYLNGRKFCMRLFVVNRKCDNLLCRKSSILLGLVKRIDVVDACVMDPNVNNDVCVNNDVHVNNDVCVNNDVHVNNNVHVNNDVNNDVQVNNDVLVHNDVSVMGNKCTPGVSDFINDKTLYNESGIIKCQPVKIELKSDAEPYALVTPRRVPFPLLQPLRETLDAMERNGIIAKVTEPTDWCSAMVPVQTKSGKIRVTVDYRKLNRSVKRERFVLPTVDCILQKLAGSKVFSSLDASGGFHQVPLDKSSENLTCFITPFGRYVYKRLPQGITLAPEIFQREMTRILQDCPGCAVFMDDIIIFGENTLDHDTNLKAVLARIKESGISLNKAKCKFRQSELVFLGNLITAEGCSPDPSKVSAIVNMDVPNNVEELRRFLGMINWIGRFIPNLSEILHPLNELLRKDVAWIWSHSQSEAFEAVKKLASNNPVLKYYDISKPTRVCSDSSSYGLGGVLEQKHNNEWYPVHFVSRTLTDTERSYAQIEKELLAGVWSMEKFSQYLVGLGSFQFVTDHKPLIPIINKKDLDQCPVRCQRMLMRIMRFNCIAEYQPGKTLVIADTLSRKPLTNCDTYVSELSQDIDSIEEYKSFIYEQVPVAKSRLDSIRDQNQVDNELSTVIDYVQHGWPQYYKDVKDCAKPYFSSQDCLSVVNGILMYGMRVVVPSSFRTNILDQIHEGHFGLNKCLDRAKHTVWWPTITSQLKNLVSKCKHCEVVKPTQRHEPLITTKLPDRPWQQLATDLCEAFKKHYLVTIDYYSRYLEIAHLNDKVTTSKVIEKLKDIFSRNGTPEVLISDNGPQFSSQEFKNFAREFDFKHETSSPRYPQSNGMSERAVQTAKRIINTEDPVVSLMNYRATPHSSTGYSPSQLLYGRQIRTKLPVSPDSLKPNWPEKSSVESNDKYAKQQHAKYYNKAHGVRTLPKLSTGQYARVKLDHEGKWSKPVEIIGNAHTPRSYVLKANDGKVFRRNRRHISSTDECPSDYVPKLHFESPISQPRRESSDSSANSGVVHNSSLDQSYSEVTDKPEVVPEPQVRKSGRVVKKPQWMKDFITS